MPMKKLFAFTLFVVAILLILAWLGTGIATVMGRNRVAIAQAQANIEQARAMQEAAIAAQEAAHAAQIASAGQTTVSIINAILFGMVLTAIIAFAVIFVYLRFFREATQPTTTRVHIPSIPREHLPEADPQQALLQQMTQMMILEILQRQMERLPQSLGEDSDA
jgi:hypothetical protein